MDLYFVIYIYILVAIIGMVMGSFLNCAAGRLCHHESIVKGRSKCDYCGHVLGPLDLIPVFSYLFSKGKCRYCGKKLNIRYPLSELASGIVYVLTFHKYGFSILTIEYLILWSLCLCMSFCDLEDFIIPDRFIICGIINRFIFMYLENGFPSELLSTLLNGLSISLPLTIVVIVMEKILKKEMMGGGDIKLIFLLGLYFNWLYGLFSLIVACIIGLIVGIIMTKGEHNKPFPFGPSICAAYFLVSMFGSGLISWYINLF